MAEIKVRNAEPSDWNWVYRRYKEAAIPRTFDVPEEDFKESFEALLLAQESHQFVLLIAEWYGIPAGYVAGQINHSFSACNKVAWLEEIFVEERLRRKGIGTELITAFEGVSETFDAVMVTVNSKAAREFWLSLYYVDSGAGDFLMKMVKYPYDSWI